MPKNKKLKPKKIPDRKYLDHYFSANSADHSMTNIHFIVHSILLTAITILISSSNINNDVIYTILALLISVVGFIASINSYIAIKRARGYLHFWISNDKSNYNELKKLKDFFDDWESFINEKSGFEFKFTRILMIKIISIIYLLFTFYIIYKIF